MKFVALLSGGKDSCFNVIKCVEHGHELVCLANLSPPASFEGEEMDSFMYQTAGHTAISKLSECFEVPLIRKEILGSAVNQKLDYLSEVAADEVEDMFVLLQQVKQQYPEVEGVSCGAIESTYQRLRVESICHRLGLTVLSYLWQRDRVGLLQEMIAAGVDAVLVKVAGAGLEPHKHLGKSLAVLQPTLMKLHEQFGLDVCGEGGEYESLVLDCSVFKKRLVLHETEVLVDEENYTVGNLRIKSCSTVPKESGCPVATALSNPDVALLQRIDITIRNVHHSATNKEENIPLSSTAWATLDSEVVGEEASTGMGERQVNPTTRRELTDRVKSLPRLKIGSDGYGQTALMLPYSTENLTSSASNDEQVQNQVRELMVRLQAGLQNIEVTMADVVFVHLYIASNEVFKAVNDEYCKWFGHYPPSRSCVCVPLPEGTLVCMDAQFLKGSHVSLLSEGRSLRRNVLHVKSMSEWAPLCIGPYAQANVLHRSLIFVAGQIPLNPADMKLFDPAEGLRTLSSDLRDSIRTLVFPTTTAVADASVASVASGGGEDLESSTLVVDDVDPTQGQLSSVALNVFVQVTLCLRHAHRVLQVLNSSLSRTLACTVYVNATALQALGGALVDSAITGSSPTDSKKNCLISEEQLQVFVRKVLWQMDRADTAVELNKTKKEQEGEGSDDEEFSVDENEDDSQQQDDDYPASKAYPVLIISTSGLPRDALVEVEIAAFAHSTIPVEALIYRQASAASSVELDTTAVLTDSVKKMEDSVVAQIDALPIWSVPSLSQSGMLQSRGPSVGVSSLEEMHCVQYSAQAQYVSLSRGLCMGFVSVRAHRQRPAAVSTEFGTELAVLDAPAVRQEGKRCSELWIDLDEAAQLLVQEVSAMLHKAKLNGVFLRTLRVYYAAGTVSTEDLAATLAGEMCAILGVKKFPVVLVPMQALDLAKEGVRRTVLAAQVSAFDLAQIDTEEWIHVKE
eukprot:gene19480-22147_t